MAHLPPHHSCVLDIHLLKHLLLQLAHVVKLVSQPEISFYVNILKLDSSTTKRSILGFDCPTK